MNQNDIAVTRLVVLECMRDILHLWGRFAPNCRPLSWTGSRPKSPEHVSRRVARSTMAWRPAMTSSAFRVESAPT